MNSLEPKGKVVKFEDRKTLPIVTLMLVVTTIAIYCVGAAGRGDVWYSTNTIQPEQFWLALQKMDFATIGNGLIYSNFASYNMWAMILSIYFLWLFGSAVEQRLGPARYFLLIILGTTIPWIVQAWDGVYNGPWALENDPTPRYTLNYFGPGLLTFALLGAYIILKPEKKVDLSGGMPRPRGEIFRKKKEKPVDEKYGLNPWMYVAAFLVFQVGLHFVTRWLWHGFDTCSLFAAIAAAGIGYGMALMLLNAAVATFKEGPLKLEAIKRYNELVDLDVSPEDAIKGTARAMGLPMEQIRDWINKNKGRLRIS
jgi:membrane associated rhomboid family serine protease